MKRFVSLFAVVALVVAMAVPAMAAESNTLAGEWHFKGSLELSSMNDSIKKYYFTFTSNEKKYIAFAIKENCLYYYTGTTSNLQGTLVYSMDTGWKNDAFRTVVFDDGSVTDDGVIFAWFTSSADRVVPQCDGSACPVTDVDGDYICDECGLPIAYSLRGDSTYSYNGLLLPVLPNLDYDAYWVMFPSGDTAYRLVAASKPFSVENGEVYVYEQTSLVFFAAGHSSSEWSQYSTQNITTKYSVGDSESIVWASHNIVNKETGDLVFNGDANFRDPLWVEMEQVTQGGMTGLIQTMGGTVKTLVVCGVGLMACLVVLSLFGKRSLIFRS